MKCTVSDLIIALMKKHGMRYVFGLPAAQISGIMDGVSRDPYFSYLTTRHEEASAHMAHAIGRITDSMAMCFATVGPGATNMVPGVAAAWGDNIPLLAITADNQSYASVTKKYFLQACNQVELYSPITKWNAMIYEAQIAPELFETAIREASSGRHGPVHLDLPCDIGFKEFDFDVNLDTVCLPGKPMPDQASIESAAQLLLNAKRPCIIGGGGVVRSRAVSVFRDLLQLSEIPALTSPNGNGLVPPDYPKHLGGTGFLGGPAVFKALDEADVILAVGCKFSSWIPVNKPPLYKQKAGQKIIQIDIDPSVLGRNANIDLAIVADAGSTLTVLLDALGKSPKLSIDNNWAGDLSKIRKLYLQELEEIADDSASVPGGRLNSAAVAKTVAKLVSNDAFVCIDGGQTMQWAHSFFKFSDPQCQLYNPGMGHLGSGTPFANAAKFAYPEREVINFLGDGAFGCTIQELETAARYNINAVHIVCNDSHWGMYRPLGEVVFDNPKFGTALTNVDYVSVARGFGCYAERVENIDDLPGAYRRAKESGRPAVLDVITDYISHPMDSYWSSVVLADAELPAAKGFVDLSQ